MQDNLKVIGVESKSYKLHPISLKASSFIGYTAFENK